MSNVKAWHIVCEPHGENPGPADSTNLSGIVIFVRRASDGTKQEVSRVAYVRRHSRNPKVKFRKQLNMELDKARDACRLLNEQLASMGKMQ